MTEKSIVVWAEKEDLSKPTVCMIGNCILVDLEKGHVAIKWSVRDAYRLERKARYEDEELRRYTQILSSVTQGIWPLPLGQTVVLEGIEVSEYWTKVPWEDIPWEV